MSNKSNVITGLDLLKKINNKNLKIGTKLILKNKKNVYNDMLVYIKDSLLYVDLFGQQVSLSSQDILDSKFKIYIDTENLYNKAIKRLMHAHYIKDEDDTYNAIACLEQEIDYYREVIQLYKNKGKEHE